MANDNKEIIEKDGLKAHYLNGKLHRENGPVIEDADGNKSWYINRLFKRKEEPNIEKYSRSKNRL